MEKSLDLNGVDVLYDFSKGHKKTCAVLIHGFGLNREMWAPQMDALSPYTVINLDARGHGKSQPCPAFSVTDVADDVAAILEHEKIEKAVIIGLSMGSYAAQEFLRLYPEKVQGALFADGTPIFIEYPKWEKIALKWSTPLLKLYRWENLKKAMAKQTSVKPDVQNQLIAMFDTQTKDAFIHSWAGIVNALHEADVSVKIPVCVVYGEQDKTGTIKLHAKDWETLYPGCEVYAIPDAGHVSNMDNPDVFNRIMLNFLSAV